MSFGESWVKGERFSGFFLGDGDVLATEKHSGSKEVGGSGVGRKSVLLCKGMTGIVVASCVDVAEGQDVGWVRFGFGCPGVSFFKQWDGVGWTTHPEEGQTAELGCDEVGGWGGCECFFGFREAVQSVERFPSETVAIFSFWIGVEGLKGLFGVACVDGVLDGLSGYHPPGKECQSTEDKGRGEQRVANS